MSDRLARRYRFRRLAAPAVATVLGLAACGGSNASHTTTRAAATTAVASVSSSSTATVAASTHRTHVRHHAAKPAPATTTATTTATETVTAARTSIAPTALTPRYQGPSPIGCLTATGLNRARAAHEPGVWEANAGLTAINDRMAIVFLAGPLKSARVARDYARSLTVVELAASGGDWVASAAIPSHLDRQVAQAAACMGHASARGASH